MAFFWPPPPKVTYVVYEWSLCPNDSQYVQIIGMSRNVQKHTKISNISKFLQKCPNMSEYVKKYSNMSKK